MFIVSGAKVVKGEAPADAFRETVSGIAVLVENADGIRCDRCWTFTTDTVSDGEGHICARCKRIIEG